MDAREVALLALNTSKKQGDRSDGALKKLLAQSGLDSRDAALATRLCFGVLQNELLLDYYLSCFSNTPLGRMEAKVVLLLRLGLYQMLFLTRIPHSAAVNSSVELTRKYCAHPRAAGMVNGILRAIERKLDELPQIPREDKVEYLSIRYSHPKWLVEQLLHRFETSELENLLEANNSIPPITVQTNTCRIDSAGLMRELTAQGVAVTPHPWLADCFIVADTGNIEALESFQCGLFYVQDPASRLAVLASGVQPDMRVLDCCAAPGGKSFALSIRMENRGEVHSCDLHSHKKHLIQAGADRLGLDSIVAQTADATVYRPDWDSSFDLVLADVPCSGLGVIRKKPDIRYKDQGALAQLPQVQLNILRNVARYVKPGGCLLYSTCTILQCENEQVVDQFLTEASDFAFEPFTLPQPIGAVQEGHITLWPHLHGTDGFFIAKLRRQA